jgi:acetyltransferase-like isoleucine patch superfamily enzyme/dTDP-4-dehydrorhamnose 3,5-epimerase-like enzyme
VENLAHSSAIIESEDIGPRCVIEPFVRISEGATVGSDCFLGTGTVIGAGVRLGNNVQILGNVNIPPNVQIGSNVIVHPGVSFVPTGLMQLESSASTATRVNDGARLGANATIMYGISIGTNSIIEPGSLITKDVPQNAVMRGHPAKIVGYGNSANTPALRATSKKADTLRPLAVKGAALHPIPLIVDLRGSLVFGEIAQHLPFTPQRFFVVYDVPSEEVRGEHAHLELHEFLICLKGSISVALDDGTHHDEVRLDSPTVGLHIPPRLWRVHYKYSPDAVMLSLCSDVYKAEDYVREYSDFLELVAGKRGENSGN